MEAGAGSRSRRRVSHVKAAGSVLIVIVVVGLFLEFMPGNGPQIGTVAERVASGRATPFGQAFARGIDAMRLGDAASAAIAFDEARVINPHIAEAHINLGFAYLAMKRTRDAAGAFDRALTIDPAKVNAYYGLGSALEAEGDRTGAIGAMRSFVHLTAADDPFRRKALSALWEWESAEKGDGQNSDSASPETKPEIAVTGKPASIIAAEAPSLPPVAEMPAALAAPEGMISIVNVWASWCAPCRAEMPSLQAFAGALDQTRYRLVGLNVDRDRDFAREFIRTTGISFSNYWDGKGTFARERFQVDSYPQTLFLDSRGAVLARVVGAREWAAASSEATMAEILAAGRTSRGQK